MAALEPTRHAIPLCPVPARLRACHMVSRGKPLTALASLLQTRTGLRPREMLNPSYIVVMAQEVKAGTRVKRAQAARNLCKDAGSAAI